MQVGSLVECISYPESATRYSDQVIPVPKAIYTVRATIKHKMGLGLHFEEIINAPRRYRDGISELCFGSEGFREVQPPMDASALFEDQLKVTNENRVSK